MTAFSDPITLVDVILWTMLGVAVWKAGRAI